MHERELLDLGVQALRQIQYEAALWGLLKMDRRSERDPGTIVPPLPQYVDPSGHNLTYRNPV